MTRIVLCLALCGAAIVPLVPAGEKKGFQATPEELKILELTNQERKAKDAPPLKLSPLLCKIARAHSENMARQGKLDHELDGKNPNDRVKESGYLSNLRGENIAFGQKGAVVEKIMKNWMDSKPHRENILLPEFAEIGIGIARDKEGQIYYTQVFARPKKK